MDNGCFVIVYYSYPIPATNQAIDSICTGVAIGMDVKEYRRRSPKCTVSRTWLITSQTSFHHGIQGVESLGPEAEGQT